jgi:hypothetical protein
MRHRNKERLKDKKPVERWGSEGKLLHLLLSADCKHDDLTFILVFIVKLINGGH